MATGKIFVATASLAVLASTTTASASDPLPVTNAPDVQRTEDSFPAVIYIPLEDQSFTTQCPVSGNTGGSSALNCGFLGDTTAPIWSTDATEQTALVDAVTAAVAPYNVRVTTERPPEYVPYHMLMVSNIELSGTSTTCTASTTGSSCDGVKRNGIGLVASKVTDSADMMTVLCETPDVTTAALFTVGRLAGLEGTDVTGDPMLFPPDWVGNMPTMFQDTCGTVTADPASCNTLAHQTHCNDMNGQMNSHLELVQVYGAGPFAEDTTAPTLANITPEDGAVIMEGDSVVMDVDITEDTDIVGVRWTINNDEILVDIGNDVPGKLTQCTNTVCDSEWNTRWIDMTASGQNWEFSVKLPAGEYVIDLEVSDLSGNIATNSVTVTVEGAAGETGTTTGGTATATSTTTDSGGSTGGGDTDTDGSASGSSGGGSGGGGGCSVQGGPAPLGALFLVGLGALRLRRRD